MKIEKQTVPGFKSFTIQSIIHYLALGITVLGIAFLIARDILLGIILTIGGIVVLLLNGIKQQKKK